MVIITTNFIVSFYFLCFVFLSPRKKELKIYENVALNYNNCFSEYKNTLINFSCY